LDLIASYYPTTVRGVKEVVMIQDGMRFKFIDAGYQVMTNPHSSLKWLNCFTDVDSIVFCIPLVAEKNFQEGLIWAKKLIKSKWQRKRCNHIHFVLTKRDFFHKDYEFFNFSEFHRRIVNNDYNDKTDKIYTAQPILGHEWSHESECEQDFYQRSDLGRELNSLASSDEEIINGGRNKWSSNLADQIALNRNFTLPGNSQIYYHSTIRMDRRLRSVAAMATEFLYQTNDTIIENKEVKELFSERFQLLLDEKTEKKSRRRLKRRVIKSTSTREPIIHMHAINATSPFDIKRVLRPFLTYVN